MKMCYKFVDFHQPRSQRQISMDCVTEDNEEEIKEILKECEDLIYLPGTILQRILRFKAEILIGNHEKELNLILNLVESHIPGLRLKAEIKLDAATVQEGQEPILKKEYLSFTTSHSLSLNCADIDVMVERVAEMPKEWTVVQFTPQFCKEEIFASDSEQLFTSGIHMSVFKCGQKEDLPYCITLLKNDVLTSRSDIRKLKTRLKEILSFPSREANKIMSQGQKKMYHKKRLEMEDELEVILHDLEESWLGAWKCLLIGKYTDESLEIKITELLKQFFTERSLENVSQKVENILVQAVKATFGIDHSTDKYVEEVLDYCFPGKNLEKSWKLFWRRQQLLDGTEERHPIILIIDETLDAFPWEMISTLTGHPSTRMPSLHLLYAIFKAHQDTIKEGYKIISNQKNGKFILNPGLDLNLMETRLKNFFDYWLPDWTGIAGRAPTAVEFRNLLTTSDIFSYSGHGSGTQYCPSEKIQKNKVNAVVFLFGCGSTQLVEMGPQVEMYGASQMYLLAACPCLIGMLWVVTDIETDNLTTRLLSSWIPNSEKIPWQKVDIRQWVDSGKIVMCNEETADLEIDKKVNEPDLLRALCLAKKGMKYQWNRAAVVARGIPVKLVQHVEELL
ncbi:hypothetical protein WA026_007700 [Henosepilachna vigintioctopunctata]|uniref:separase n=1 Tax=Henosepilachna vigintioctopunctata TaxID=420089 RepID=A0AAW1TYG5_9CUCU